MFLVAKSKSPLSYHFLRLALGYVYFHFGILKFFPDLSPAELLASQTIMRLSGGMLDAYDALFYLALIEVILGLALLFNVFMRCAFVLFLFHMLGTFSPIVFLPELAFKVFPLAPTMEGQYILKNVVFVAAGWGLLFPHLFFKRPHAESDSRQPIAGVADGQQATVLQPVLANKTRPSLINFARKAR